MNTISTYISQIWSRRFIRTWVFAICLAVYPLSALPSIDIKWLILGCATPILLVAALGSTIHSELRLRQSLTAMFLIASVFWLSLSTIGTVNRGVGLLVVAHQFGYLALFLAGYAVTQNGAHFRSIALAYLVGIGLASLYGFAQKFGFDPVDWDPAVSTMEEYLNLPSTFGNPNLAGHAIVIAVVLAAYMIKYKRWVLAIAVLNVLHLLMTQHRAGIFALAGAAILGFAAWMVKSRARKVSSSFFLYSFAATGMALGLILGTIVLVYNPSGLSDGSFLLRANSYYGAARMAMDRPVLGHGTGNFEIANVPYWTSYEQENFARNGRYNAHAHSEYFNLASESGLPAVFLYVVFLASLIMRGLNTYFSNDGDDRRRLGLTCATLYFAFAIDSSFGFNWRAPVSGAAAALFAGCFEGAFRRADMSEPKPGLKLHHAVLLALIPVSFACAWLEIQSFRSQVHLLKGLGAEEAGAHSAAILEFEKCAREAPWNWVPAYNAARVSTSSRNLPEADVWIDRVLQVHPNYLPALIDRTRIAIARAAAAPSQDSARDIDLLSRYVDKLDLLCPSLPEAHEYRGALLLQQTLETSDESRKVKLEQASNSFLDAIAGGAQDTGRLFYLAAHACVERGDLANAFEYATSSIDDLEAPAEALDLLVRLPHNPQTLAMAAELLQNRVSLLEKPAEKNPSQLGITYRALAKIHEAAEGESKQVLDLYEKAAEINPADDATWNAFYFSCLHLGTLNLFRTVLARAVGNNTSPKASDSCAAVESMLRNATPKIDDALAVVAQNMNTYDPYRPHPNDEALAWAADAILNASRRSSLSPIAQLNMGIVLSRTGRSTDAESVLRALPDTMSPAARRAGTIELIYAMIRAKTPNEAQRLAEEALMRYPGDSEFRLAHARSLVRQGRVNEAKAQYAEIIRTMIPTDPFVARVNTDMRELQSQRGAFASSAESE